MTLFCFCPSYDAAGNLVRKIAAGGVATCFWPSEAGGCSASALHSGGYDALNRPVVKRYSDGTPAVKWCYDGNTYLDGACQGGEVQGEKGYLTAVGNYVSSGDTTWTISSSEYKHQALGLVKWSKQVTGGNAYKFEDPTTPGDGGYVYDNGGRLTAMWYPSGRKVTYEYDGAGRVNVVGGQLGTNTLQYTSASNKISYAPHGAPVSVTFGNGLQETVRFNERLQPDLMQAGSLWKLENFYCPDQALSCASNNGNVVSQRLTAPKTAGGSLVLNTAYGYDGVNRLESALESKDGSRVWKDLYTYTDGAGAGGQYGNLRVSAAPDGYGGGTPDDLKCGSYDASTNRCIGGFQYDNGASGGPGNITAFPGDRTAAYDAENRQITLTEVTQGITSTWQHIYDGEGRRVKKALSGGTRAVVYVYDAMGQLAAEYDSAPPEPAPCARCFLTADHLGSTRLVTDASGTAQRRYDFLPFGWDLNPGYGDRLSVAGYIASDHMNPKFTGKERDSETGLGLDYFGARYFSGAQGRFTTPDAPFADQHADDPQSWNLYAYGRNNPLSFVDPTGQYVCASSVSKDECANFQKSLDQAQAAADKLKDKYGAKSSQYTSAQRAIDAYGKAGVDNGVAIKVGNTGKYGAQVDVAGTTAAKTADNPSGQNITVTFNTGLLSSTNLGTLVAHEGQHLADGSAWVGSGFSPAMNPLSYQTESNAYQVQAAIGEGMGWQYQTVSFGASPYLLWVQGWPQNNTNNVTNAILRREYNLTPASKRRAYSRATRVRR